MKIVALLVAFVGVVYSQIDVPIGALQSVRNAGIQTISVEVQAFNQKLTAAVDAFKPINATCMALQNKEIPKCRTCVESKCKARAEAVCKPEQWQIVLGKTIGFFKDGIPNFFTSTIPDVFVNKIGGGIVDVTKDIGSFFKDKVGPGLVNAGKTIGTGIVNIGKGAIGGVVDFGKKIGDGVVGIGKKIGEGFGKAIDGIKSIGGKIGDLGKSIGKAFGDLFGKREMITRETFIRSRRQGEPGCGEFENNPENACHFYLSPNYCASCGFNPDTSCPGFKAAIAAIKAANAERKWMTTIKKQNYDITKMSFNPALMTGAGAFKNVVVSVNLFGKDLQFTLQQPINPYIATVAGPIIARRALEEFRK